MSPPEKYFAFGHLVFHFLIFDVSFIISRHVEIDRNFLRVLLLFLPFVVFSFIVYMCVFVYTLVRRLPTPKAQSCIFNLVEQQLLNKKGMPQ